MSQKIYEARQKGESDTADSVAKMLASLSEDVVNVLRILGVTIEQLINLARYNPSFGAVIGIITTNIASNKVDFLHWQHTEIVCLDCNSLSVDPNTGKVTNANGALVGAFTNGFLNFFLTATPGVSQLYQGISSLSQFFASHGTPGVGGGPGSSATGHRTAYVWLPGIIDSTANLIITGIIVSSFGISAGSQILSNITAVTDFFSGARPDPTGLVKPVPPNVEAGSQIKTNQTFTKGLGPEGT